MCLYAEYSEDYNEQGAALAKEVDVFLESIFKREREAGHSIRDIEYIIYSSLGGHAAGLQISRIYTAARKDREEWENKYLK